MGMAAAFYSPIPLSFTKVWWCVLFLESETSGDFYKSSWGVFERSRDFLVFFYQAEKAIV
jgi:hypothetical protein